MNIVLPPKQLLVRMLPAARRGRRLQAVRRQGAVHLQVPHPRRCDLKKSGDRQIKTKFFIPPNSYDWRL